MFYSKLSVWWFASHVHMEYFKPGHPRQNGRYERVHLTLKWQATRPLAKLGIDYLQQAKFDAFLHEFNCQPLQPKRS
jgi:hypothetical protein